LSALSVLAVAPAQAVVIDFDSLPQFNSIGSTGIGTTYTEDGFTLTSSALTYLNRLEPAYTGSVALFSPNSFGTFRLTRTDGGTFTFSSIDVGKLNSSATGVEYFGTKADGSLVTFGPPSQPPVAGSLQTIIIPSTFTNLISVSQSQGRTFPLPPVQFDNINVIPTPIVSATDVPEPLTILGTLFGAGYSVALKRKLATSQQDKTDIN
jgi:hypothetical protein